MSTENASEILNKAMAGDPAAVFDYVRRELAGRARDAVNTKAEQPIKIKTATKEEETE